MSVLDPAIPFDALEALFLDAGNTLVSIDFDWIAAELGERGAACSAPSLRRAEARARPWISSQVATPGAETRLDFSFEHYLDAVLRGVEEQGVRLGRQRAALVAELAPVLKPEGKSARLWSWVLPGVEAALASFRDRGLKLVVVSNSDGTVEDSMVACGLRDYFDGVIDSHLVGSDKPDPGIFEAALACVGARPERTLHVGDLYSADIVGARRAGLHGLLLDPFDDWGDVDCHRLPDLPALAGALRGEAGR